MPEVANLVLITLFNAIVVVKALGTSCNLTVLQYKRTTRARFSRPFHDPLANWVRVIVTPAVYPRLVEFLHFDL
jgi:hypothetical protein